MQLPKGLAILRCQVVCALQLLSPDQSTAWSRTVASDSERLRSGLHATRFHKHTSIADHFAKRQVKRCTLGGLRASWAQLRSSCGTMAVQVHLSRCASSALRLACATFEEAATLRSSSSGARALQRPFCAAARSAPDSSSMQPTSQHLRTDLTPGGLGVITMDREKALNAFDHGALLLHTPST